MTSTLLRALNGIGLPFSEEMWRNVGDDGPENGKASVEWRAAHREVAKLTKMVQATDQRIRRLEAALRVARGYVMHGHAHHPAGSSVNISDLATVDAALAVEDQAEAEAGWTEELNLSAEARQLINKTPFLLSLLYDLDLLPAQLLSQDEITPGLIKAYHRLYGVLYCYQAMQQASPTPTDAGETKT